MNPESKELSSLVGKIDISSMGKKNEREQLKKRTKKTKKKQEKGI